MKSFWYKYKSFIVTFLVGLIIGGVIFCLYFFIKGMTLINAINACSISGVSLFGVALIVIITRLGAFDTFSYGFKQMFSSMFGRDPNVYNSLADYKLEKYDQRKKKNASYLMFFLVGLLFFLAVIVLEIILHAIIN